MPQNIRLDPLPESTDRFWEHANLNKHELRDTPKCEHFFVRKQSNECECRKCHVGYFLSPAWEVKPDGHIYAKGQKVI